MSAGDGLLFFGVIVFSVVLVMDAIKLAREEDWLEQITRTHATAYSRLAEYAFWSLRHVIAACTERELRRERIYRTLLCIGTFGLVVMPILIAAQVADVSEVSLHPIAFAIGTAAWSVVVESPSLSYRIPAHEPDSFLVPPMVTALIVAVLDLVIIALASSGFVADDSQSFATGAAFVAVGDLVSGLVGLTTATAKEYPFKDPQPKLAEPDQRADIKPPGAGGNTTTNSPQVRAWQKLRCRNTGRRSPFTRGPRRLKISDRKSKQND